MIGAQYKHNLDEDGNIRPCNSCGYDNSAKTTKFEGADGPKYYCRFCYGTPLFNAIKSANSSSIDLAQGIAQSFNLLYDKKS